MSSVASDCDLREIASAAAARRLLADPDALFARFITLCADAGAAIMRHYGDCAVEAKSDLSPVTAADTDAEALITLGLTALARDIPIVAEEASAAGVCPDPCAALFVVDPVDGTREFVRGPDEGQGAFTVNIALVIAGEPAAGVVYAPAWRRIWFGARNHGAWAGDLAPEVGAQVANAQPIHTHAPGAEGVIALISGTSNPRGVAAVLDRYQPSAVQRLSSSAKIVRIAEGSAHVYPRCGPTMAWDIAAGDAVLRAAGGGVRDFNGALMQYGCGANASDKPYLNPSFIALGGVDFKAA